MTLAIFCRLVSKTHCCRLNQLKSILDYIPHLNFDLSGSLKVKYDSVTGLSIYAFLLTFNSNMWPNSAPLWYIRLQNVSDLEIDLWRSLKVKCDFFSRYCEIKVFENRKCTEWSQNEIICCNISCMQRPRAKFYYFSLYDGYKCVLFVSPYFTMVYSKFLDKNIEKKR